MKYFISILFIFNFLYPCFAQTADEYLAQAEKKMSILDYAGALKDFDKALLQDKNNAIALNMRGSVKEQLGDFKGAFQDYEKAVEIKNDPAAISASCLNLANLYSSCPEHALRNPAKSLEYAIKVSKEIEGDDFVYDVLAMAYSENHLFEQAILNQKKALALNPSHPFYNERVKAYQNKVTFTEWLDRRIKIDMRKTSGQETHFESPKQAEYANNAILFFENQMKSNPKNPKPYLDRGHVEFVRGDFQGALKDFNEAIFLKPDYYEAYYNRAIVYAKTGKIDLSLKDYGKVIELKRGYAPAYINRGNLHIKLKKYENALDDFNNAILLNQNDPDAYYNRGLCCYYMNNFKSALDDFEKCLKINPNHALAINNRRAIMQKNIVLK